MPSQGPFHQAVLSRVIFPLYDFVKARSLGVVLTACDVLLSRHDVLQPDGFYISNERRTILAEKYIDGAPDLVIEVLLPESAEHDRLEKAKRYEAFGVREMWLVSPEGRSIEVLVNTPEGFRSEALYRETDRVRSAVLPGLDFPAAPIFRPI